MLSIEEVKEPELQNLKKHLQKQFEDTFPLSSRYFYIGIADYIKTVEESKILLGIINDSILKEEKELIEKLKIYSQEAVKNGQQIFNQLHKTIKENKIENRKIQEAIDEHIKHSSGKTQWKGTDSFATLYIRNVKNIIIVLKKYGYKKIINNFAVFDERDNLISWKLSDLEQKLNDSILYYRRMKEVSIWGDWEKLWFIYLTIYLKVDSASSYALERVNYGPLMGDLIEPSKTKLVDKDQNESKIRFYRLHCRLKFELDDLITSLNQETGIEQKESNFRYDSEGAMLFYKDNLILNMHKNSSGRSKMFNSLWEGRKLIKDDRTIVQGNPAILRSELCKISGYQSNENIDKAIAFFRKKLKELPIEITAEKGFRIIIKD